MIAVVDNHDSFTGSLLQCLATLGAVPQLLDGGRPAAAALAGSRVEGLVLACDPEGAAAAGLTAEALGGLAGSLPVLGIGPGHRTLAGAYGARVAPAPRLLHGSSSPVLHHSRGLFAGLENPFAAARYHALVVERASLPVALEITAWTPEGEIMGLRHRDRESWGVQFPPQSILTRSGLKLIENFLTLCRQQKEVPR
jgi:anthranilate synthase component 2